MSTTKVAIAPMKVAQIPKAGADFEIVEREIPKPGAGQVRIKVQACGVCHSDLFTKEGLWPGIQYPRDFVSWNAGILNSGPRTFLGEHVTVANATGLHFDAYLSCVRGWNFAFDDLELSSRF